MIELKYSVKPEKTVWIDISEKKEIKMKAILRGDWRNPLVILVHGRPGSGNDLLEFLGAKYLSEKGFSTLRIYLYDEDPRARNMADCTIHTFAQDLDTAIKYARSNGSLQIFATGHSYGGPTILLANEKIDGAVLWDPSHGLVWKSDKYKIDQIEPNEKFKDLRIYRIGMGYVFPEAMVEDEQSWGDTTNWAKNKKYPLKVINASNGILAEYGRNYIDIADKPKEHLKIEGAGHLFDDSDEVMLQLFEETEEWFNRYKI